MNYYFNYARLSEIADKEKPFRGTNRYPIENRRHTYKYFTIDTDTDGQRMFNIGYYHHHEKEMFTKEQYEDIIKNIKSKSALSKYNEETTWDEFNRKYVSVGKFYKYIKKDRILAKVRADNTIEFTETDYGQGDRHFLTGDNWRASGYFSTSVRHGGSTYFFAGTSRKRGIPIFKGLRFHIESKQIHADSKYIFRRRVVNRKKVKEAFKKYEQPFNLAKTMLGAMTYEVFKDDMQNVIEEYFGNEIVTNGWFSHDHTQKAMKIADSIILDKPLDAIYLYIRAIGIRFWQQDAPINAFQRVQHRLKKHLYYINDTFDYDEYGTTDLLPTSSWDMDLIVNGKIIKR
jgi:hypothetical protein